MDVVVKISNLKDLLDKKISIAGRGVLITLLLIKNPDDSPQLLWSKLNLELNISKIRDTLIELHELGVIEWSGYKNAKQSQLKELFTDEVKEVVEFSNKVWGTKRQVREPLAKLIFSRLREYSLKDIKLVISNRYEEWKDDPFMKKYLVLETVLRPSNFSKYLDEALLSKKGTGIIQAEEFNLKKGDQINPFVLSAIQPQETYRIREYYIDENGNPSGIPTLKVRYGRDVIRFLNQYKRDEENNRGHEFIWIYWPEN